MNQTEVIELCRESILVMLAVAAPMLVIEMIVGLIISLFQTVTQINEPTLTFMPKMLVTFGAAIFLMPYMIAHLIDFMQKIADRIVGIGLGSG
ncbi:flagellar biosynthesis protein FliQ [uncultured Gammaproteobacteria bacterium]